MSGAAFEGIEAEPASESYTGGEAGAHQDLVRRLVGWATDTRTPYLGLDAEALHIRELLERHQVSDANAFLDEAVLQLAASAPAEETFSASHHLLDPLVQALYDMGHDRLVLDLTLLEKRPLMIADFLHGTAERKLDLTIIGDLYCMGQQAHNCSIVCQGAVSGIAGSHAVTCDFLFSGSVSAAGPNAYGCTFDLPSWNAIPPPFEFTSSSQRDRRWTFPTECTYYVHGEVSEPAIEYYRRRGFFIAKNVLHYLTPDGVWRKAEADEPVEMVRPT